jgi:uncharacterized protein YndB with AHSA1/START domain
MPFDLDAHLAAMTRTVRSGSRDGAPTKVVAAARTYATTPEDLWDAVTSAERIGRWFLPITGDLRLGGRYQLHGNAGGLIEACDPPRHLAVTWEYGGQVSWLTLDVAPDGDGARLELEHVAPFDAGSPAAEFWAMYGPGATGVGWDMAFQGLARHVEDPDAPAPDPEAVAAWATSPEAAALYGTASRAWAEADMADGTPEAEAMAAAERTRAFYSGEAAPMT